MKPIEVIFWRLDEEIASCQLFHIPREDDVVRINHSQYNSVLIGTVETVEWVLIDTNPVVHITLRITQAG